MRNIALLTVSPHREWLDFLLTFTQYNIFIIVDDTTIDITELQTIYPRFRFIQIDENECASHNFVESCILVGFKRVIAWDKALYYFSTLHNENTEQTWFIEEDVFLYDENTILNIDRKYKTDTDLIISDCIERVEGGEWWHWDNFTIYTPPPHYKSMICAVRMSSTLIQRLKEYVDAYKTLHFIEGIIPTVAMNHQLQIETIDELKTLIWRYNWTEENVNKTGVFHPIKDISQHNRIRATFSTPSQKT